MPSPTSPDTIPAQSTLSSIARIEWQTVVLATVIYGGFFTVTWFWQSLPVLLVIALGGWLVAWQGSLQHEVIHGHPTRSRVINDAIGWPPLSLWLPYAIYREGHLTHHRDEHLTDPIEDPESSYFTQTAWERMGGVGRRLAVWNTTLLGRLTLGPLVMIVNFLAQEAVAVMSGDRQRAALWMRHAIGVAAVLAWVLVVCDMPLWLYLFGFVYIGAALSRLRSFAEHRFADHHDERTAIVENSPLFGLLFLYNNLHVLHHKRPGVPWYKIPLIYHRHRDALIQINGGLVYDGYLDVARRFLLKPHDDPRHPRHTLSDFGIVEDVREFDDPQRGSGRFDATAVATRTCTKASPIKTGVLTIRRGAQIPFPQRNWESSYFIKSVCKQSSWGEVKNRGMHVVVRNRADWRQPCPPTSTPSSSWRTSRSSGLF